MTGLQIFQTLQARMGSDGAEAFITYVDTSLKDNRNELVAAIRREFATKEDLVNVRGELKEDMARLEGKLEVKISDVRTDVIRWMFAFFVTMLLAILGLYFKK